MTTITAAEFANLEGLDEWRFVLGDIHAEFELSSFTAAAAFVAELGVAADAADHHPDIALRHLGRVRVAMHSHDAHGLTDRDVSLARTISAIAAERGATTSPVNPIQAVEIAIDTMDADRIRPFWAAVLGYTVSDGALVDPSRRGPAVWFQQMDEPREQRQRFHIDVSVPHDVAEARVAAAVAAGGRLVSNEFARSWWVLADEDGNEACVCTWQDRSSRT
jgi:4a-hydroxytetrahydrobiopterin dehydratase